MNQIGHHTSVTVDGLDYLISVRAIGRDKDGTALLHQAAAAQDMLSALRLILEYEIGGSLPLTVPRGLAVDRARAAIAKAEGRP